MLKLRFLFTAFAVLSSFACAAKMPTAGSGSALPPGLSPAAAKCAFDCVTSTSKDFKSSCEDGKITCFCTNAVWQDTFKECYTKRCNEGLIYASAVCTTDPKCAIKEQKQIFQMLGRDLCSGQNTALAGIGPGGMQFTCANRDCRCPTAKKYITKSNPSGVRPCAQCHKSEECACPEGQTCLCPDGYKCLGF